MQAVVFRGIGDIRLEEVPDVPHLIHLVRGGLLDPSEVITQHEPLRSAIEAFEAFDQRESGWLKVELEPRSR